MRPVAQSELCAQVAPAAPKVAATHVEPVAAVVEATQLDPSTQRFSVSVGSHGCPNAAGATQLPQGACAIVPKHDPLWHCSPFWLHAAFAGSVPDERQTSGGFADQQSPASSRVRHWSSAAAVIELPGIARMSSQC
jgi:hypothetical protein